MKYIKAVSFNNYIEANIALGLLQQNDVNCYLDDEKNISIDPLLNASFGGNLMVSEPELERAKEIIKLAEVAFLNDTVCPYCHKTGLVAEIIVDKPATFWGKLKNLVSHGQTEVYTKKYRCQHCKSLMNELPSTF
jgi:hypothetical protein